MYSRGSGPCATESGGGIRGRRRQRPRGATADRGAAAKERRSPRVDQLRQSRAARGTCPPIRVGWLAMSLLSIANVTKRYRRGRLERVAVRDVSLNIEPGEL